VVNTDFGAADGAGDRVTIQGRDVSDEVNITPVGAVVEVTGLRYDVNVLNAGSGADIFEFFGNNGNDNIVSPLDASLTSFFTAANFRLNGGLGDDFITGYGLISGNEGNDSLIGGSEAQTINGGDGEDFISGGGGIDDLNGDAGEDTFLANFDSAIDSIDGGTEFDTILIQATSATIGSTQSRTAPPRFALMSGPGGGTGVVGGPGRKPIRSSPVGRRG
jgi:Ca2+-binding RTX toxin-like protein